VIRRALILPLLVAAPLVVGCGSQGIDLASNASPAQERGAQLFSDRCSGCHSLDVVGAHGSSINAADKEHTDGPNFNVRREDKQGILYAIRNGGFSGAIMPENIVTGQDAEAVADFLAKYAGSEVETRDSAKEAGDTGGS
jgi:mono/diheme cytochrome c family protein